MAVAALNTHRILRKVFMEGCKRINENEHFYKTGFK